MFCDVWFATCSRKFFQIELCFRDCTLFPIILLVAMKGTKSCQGARTCKLVLTVVTDNAKTEPTRQPIQKVFSAPYASGHTPPPPPPDRAGFPQWRFLGECHGLLSPPSHA